MKKQLFIIISFLVFGLSYGQQTYEFDHKGVTRKYILYLPDNVQENAPLVFVLHGTPEIPENIMGYSGMNNVADTAGFVVCYPDGETIWEVGYKFQEIDTINDLDYLVELAHYLQETYNLDAERTFCSGFSNGADMSFKVGCEAPQTFKAFAAGCGALMVSVHENCNSSIPVPAFIFNGDIDHITEWEGDMDTTSNNVWGAYYGVEAGARFFAEANLCRDSVVDTLPNENINDQSIIIRKKFINGLVCNEVWLYKMDNVGHKWTGMEYGNKDIYMEEHIWNFFNRCKPVLPTKAEELELSNLFVYPNPFQEVVYIKRESKVSEVYQIFTMEGKLLKTGKLYGRTDRLNLEPFSKGIYLLKIGNKAMKVIKD